MAGPVGPVRGVCSNGHHLLIICRFRLDVYLFGQGVSGEDKVGRWTA